MGAPLLKNTAVLLFLSISFCCSSQATAEIQLYGLRHYEGTYQRLLPDSKEALDVDAAYFHVPPPYTDNIEYELIYNPEVDLVHIMTPNVARFDEANWVLDLAKFPEMHYASSNHYEYVKSTLFRNGKLMGLGLGTTLQSIPLINLQSYKELGLSRIDMPNSWDALYDQVVERTEACQQLFFFPAWHNSKPGLVLSFIVEVLNRGGSIVDPATGWTAMKEHSGPAYETLLDWRRVWESGAVPPHVLDLNYIGFRKEYAEKNYPLSIQSSDILLKAKSHAAGIERPITLIPRTAQSWGTPVTTMLSIVRHDDMSVQRTRSLRRLVHWISRGSNKGRFSFSEHFLKDLGLLPVYKDFLGSEHAQEILKNLLIHAGDDKILMDLIDHAEVPRGYWNVVWQEELSDYLLVELRKFLKDSTIKPEHLISRINKKISYLKSTYGY